MCLHVHVPLHDNLEQLWYLKPMLFSMLLTIIILICRSFSAASTSSNEWIWRSSLWRTAPTVGFSVSISMILMNEGQDLPTWGHLLISNLSYEFLVIEKSNLSHSTRSWWRKWCCVHVYIFFLFVFYAAVSKSSLLIGPKFDLRPNECLSSICLNMDHERLIDIHSPWLFDVMPLNLFY